MRLSHYLSSSVSLWITHFTLYANGTSIWFPYEVGGPFLSRLESFRSVPLPVEHSPPRVPESPRCFRSLFKPPSTVESDLSEPPVVINQDKQAFEYFKTAYSNLEASYPHRKFILQQSIAYLVRKESISLEHLELWCRELLNIAENHPTGDEMSIIMHGFNTLILKHFGKTDVTRKLGSFMPMSPLRFLPSQEVVGDFQALDREIIAPGTGLSKALRNFLHDVQSWQPEEVEYAPPRVSPPANPKGFRRYFGSASSSIRPNVQAFKYFQTAYSNPGLDDPDRTSLLQQAMKYLAQKEDISPNHGGMPRLCLSIRGWWIPFRLGTARYWNLKTVSAMIYFHGPSSMHNFAMNQG
ncbi:hypothetical protein PCANC_17240 [Puccinia coronata f. sp. avenae]|uniref:Uncharacterized protein n=1 Tax=Puccinia coronata f. sp. avenae TaxID=200324 RepID=A0A2N5U5B9_9BASI|nr:hypothetical protein PCANC_17240 [Puccinia coronata f. sp. avenae]